MKSQLNIPSARLQQKQDSEEFSHLLDSYLEDQQFDVDHPEDSEQEQKDKDKENPISRYFYKPIMKPLNMIKDYEDMLEERRQKKELLKVLTQEHQQLRACYLQLKKQGKLTENALYKVSMALPSSTTNTQKMKSMQLEQSAAIIEQMKKKEMLEKVKKSMKFTARKESEIIFAHLSDHNERLGAELKQLKLENQALLKSKDTNWSDEALYRKKLEGIKMLVEDYKLNATQELRSYKILESEVEIKIMKDKLAKSLKENQELSKKVSELKLENEGIQYECQIIRQNQEEAGELEAQQAKYKARIIEKKEKFSVLNKALEEKSRISEYISNWTADLQRKLQDKKIEEARVKADLENQITNLNHEYEKENRSYKTDLMEENNDDIPPKPATKKRDNKHSVMNNMTGYQNTKVAAKQQRDTLLSSSHLFSRKQSAISVNVGSNNQLIRPKMSSRNSSNKMLRSTLHIVAEGELNKEARDSKGSVIERASRQIYMNLGITSASELRRAKPVKFYEIDSLCKKINYFLALEHSSLAAFCKKILGEDEIVTLKMLLQRLKQVNFLDNQQDILKLARYIIEDNRKPNMEFSVNRSLATTIVQKMIGTVETPEEYEEHERELKNFLEDHCQKIKQELSSNHKLVHFNEEQLRDSLIGLGLRIPESLIKHFCMRLFQESREIDSYYLSSIDNLYKKESDTVYCIEIDSEPSLEG